MNFSKSYFILSHFLKANKPIRIRRLSTIQMNDEGWIFKNSLTLLAIPRFLIVHFTLLRFPPGYFSYIPFHLPSFSPLLHIFPFPFSFHSRLRNPLPCSICIIAVLTIGTAAAYLWWWETKHLKESEKDAANLLTDIFEMVKAIQIHIFLSVYMWRCWIHYVLIKNLQIWLSSVQNSEFFMSC